MNNFIGFVLIIVLCIFGAKPSFALQAVQDSVQTVEFLKTSGPLQGLQYKIFLPASGKAKAQENLLMVKTSNDYGKAIHVLDSVNTQSEKSAHLQFFIFDQKATFPEVKEYISLLRKNELLLEKKERQFDNSLILEANRIPFQPFYKLKSRIFDDIKFVILLGIMTLFFVTFIMLLFFLVVIRAKNVQKTTQIKKFERMCQTPLSFLLMESSREDFDRMDFASMRNLFPAEHFSKNLFKETLLKEIISLNKNLKGEFKDRLKLIYNCLNLHHLSIKKLKSGKWDTLSSGIVEVNEMDVSDAIPFLEPLVAHKNFIVRTNAVRALLNLSPKKDLQFLANQKYPLSKWQQMAIYRVIKYIASEENIDLSKLLESENTSVRVFGIRLVRYLGKMDSITQLSEMFFSSTDEEKTEILITFKALAAFTEVDLVNKAFRTQSQKIAIIAAEVLGDIGNEESLQLMVNRLNETDLEFDLTKNILKSIMALSPDKLEEITQTISGKKLNAIRDHLKDPLFAYV